MIMFIQKSKEEFVIVEFVDENAVEVVHKLWINKAGDVCNYHNPDIHSKIIFKHIYV